MKSINNFLKTTALAALLLGVGACQDDFLDVSPQGEFTPEDFFSSNPQAAEGLVNAVYNKMLDWNIHSFSWNGVSSITSDDADKGSDPGDTGTDKNELDNYTFTPTSLSFNEIWEGNYQGIARANQALRYLPELTISDSLKTRLIGEASFLRAYFYFNLVRSFGGVPRVTTVPDPTNASELEAARVRASAADIYALIEADLTTAIASLPPKGGVDVGRATRGAAQALLAKVSMYQKKWAQVQSLTDALIASGQYALATDYATLWREVGENNIESIFEVQGLGLTPNKGVQGYVESQSVRGQFGWGFNVPTADLTAAYEPGDKRRDATIIFAGETLWDGVKITADVPNPRYSEKAYVSQTKETFNGSLWETNKNIRVLRFAEVLLMNAEASNELGNSTQALESLNKVRVRAGLTPATAAAQTALRTAIWNERRVELAFEHDRTFDLRRQGRAGVVMRAHGKPYVDGKHDLFPIPQRQIDLSGNTLTQNPGY
jgi:hypothetical protein